MSSRLGILWEWLEKHRPEFKAMQDQQVQKIRGILTDSQQAEYTKMLDEREKRRQRDRRP